MKFRATYRWTALAVVASLLIGCTSVNPPPSAGSPSASVDASPSASASSPAASPSAAPPAPATFPLAAVTGMTNLKSTISMQQLGDLAARNRLLVPCGIQVAEPSLTAPADCRSADTVAGWLRSHQQRIALLPPGLVEPATKVLSIAGSGPFGMFGPDLFGDAKARAKEYPVVGAATGAQALDASWLSYDPAEVWTLTNIGSLCADRWAAHQAVALGKGWHWIFNGGTARYAAPAPVDPPVVPPFENAVPVDPIDTGNAGAVAKLLRRSDVAIADHECPVVPSAGFTPRAITDPLNVFSVPEDVLPEWRDFLGLDAVYLAANHMSDQGVAGVRSTLDLMDEYGVARTGLGMNLRQALEPTYVDVAGLKIGFVAFNDVAGVQRAAAGVPGVPWITRRNAIRGVQLARQGGADMVICNPQWWGGAEYHDDLWPLQETQLGWFEEAGCDHVIGSGTHVAGPMLIRPGAHGPSVTLVSPGNFVFGQGWWQEAQEGVILDLTFRGQTLVNVRMRPTVQVLAARPSLLDPQAEGSYVLKRIYKYSELGSAR